MANRNFHQFKGSLDRGVVLVQGLIPLTALAAVGTVAIQGVESVVKSAAGTYTITLQDQYVALLSAQVTAESLTDQDIVPQVKSFDVVSAKTVVIKTCAAGVAADVSAAAKLHILLILKNSSVN